MNDSYWKFREKVAAAKQQGSAGIIQLVGEHDINLFRQLLKERDESIIQRDGTIYKPVEAREPKHGDWILAGGCPQVWTSQVHGEKIRIILEPAQ